MKPTRREIPPDTQRRSSRACCCSHQSACPRSALAATAAITCALPRTTTSTSFAAWAAGIGPAWSGYARNAQHTALGAITTQPFNQIRWRTPVDLAPQYSGSSLLITMVRWQSARTTRSSCR